MKRNLIVASLATALLSGGIVNLTGCSSSTEQEEAAPVEHQVDRHGGEQVVVDPRLLQVDKLAPVALGQQAGLFGFLVRGSHAKWIGSHLHHLRVSAREKIGR